MKLAILCLLITSCALKPQLYPNEKLKQSGPEQSKIDIEGCIKKANSIKEKESNHLLVNKCLAEKGYHVLNWE
jgi:hypothetical protein